MSIRENLFPKQLEALNAVEAAWAAGRPYVLQIGQRGGKTTLIRALVEEAKPNSHLIAVTFSQATQDPALYEGARHLTFWGAKEFKALLARSSEPAAARRLREATVIIDEAFWISGGEALFVDLQQFTHRILAIGSAHDLAWITKPDMVLTTWEANLNLPESSAFMRTKREQDSYTYHRDFGYGPPTAMA